MDAENSHNVTIIDARVDHGKMKLMIKIDDWDEQQCFFYPLDAIDNKSLKIHVMWKMSNDCPLPVHARAVVDVLECPDPAKLNIHDWEYA